MCKYVYSPVFRHTYTLAIWLFFYLSTARLIETKEISCGTEEGKATWEQLWFVKWVNTMPGCTSHGNPSKLYGWLLRPLPSLAGIALESDPYSTLACTGAFEFNHKMRKLGGMRMGVGFNWGCCSSAQVSFYSTWTYRQEELSSQTCFFQSHERSNACLEVFKCFQCVGCPEIPQTSKPLAIKDLLCCLFFWYFQGKYSMTSSRDTVIDK